MGEFLIWLVMGLVEGLTNVFPISSTAHLSLLGRLLRVQPFDLPLVAGLHGGSLIAITVFFHTEFENLWKAFVESIKYGWAWISRRQKSFALPFETMTPYLYGSSLLPVAIEGWLLRPYAEETFGHEYLPLIFLIINGAIILLTAWFVKGERTIREVRWWEFLTIGMIQGLAVMPGISRLGLVLCAGLAFRLKWQEALKFTFIVSVPVVVGAIAVEFGNILFSLENNPNLIFVFLVGNLFAYFGSWFSLKLLTSKLLERRKLALFGYYCLMLGSFSSLYFYFWT